MSEDFDRYWRRRFEETARLYEDDHAVALWSHKGLEARKEVFFSVFRESIRGTQTILDLGCGPGVYGNTLSVEGHIVYGLDFVFSALSRAKVKQQVSGSSFSLVNGNAYYLPFRDATFDIVLCLGVLQNLWDESEVLRQINRVLRPGGLLFLMTRNSLFLPNRSSERTSSRIRNFNPFALLRTLRQHNYAYKSMDGIFIIRSRRIRHLEPFLNTFRRLENFTLPLILAAEAFLLCLKKQ